MGERKGAAVTTRSPEVSEAFQTGWNGEPPPRKKEMTVGSTKMPTAIDLFSGCGGLTSGLRSAGFEVLAAIEKDSDSANTYTANHRSVVVYNKDIRRVTAKSLLERLGLEKGELDLVAGCPPCQGFTRLTEKSLRNDPRNELIYEYLRFVRVLRPQVCMLENVPGLLSRGKEIFDDFCAGVESLGYIINCQVLELADYGVPQFRKRLVMLAGLGRKIEIPPPTHCDPLAGRTASQRPWRTVQQAIRFLPRPPRRSRVVAGKTHPRYRWHFSRDITRDVRLRLLYAIDSGKGRVALPPSLRLKCHQRHPNGYYDVYGAMSWDSPSPTITSGCTNASKGRFGHPSSPRPLTATEAAKLQTFPLTYKFEGSGLESVAVQIGNALPKRFATVIGRAVVAQLTDSGVGSKVVQQQ